MKQSGLLFSIVFSTLVLGFVSCTKDKFSENHCVEDRFMENQNAKSKEDVITFSIEGVSTRNRDYYKLLDKDRSIFEWRAFQDGEFLFDTEIIWEIENPVHRIYNINNHSFDVEFENGDTLHVFDVSSVGQTTRSKIYNERGELVEIRVDFDREVDFVDVLLQGEKMSDMKVGPLYPIIRALYYTAVTVVAIYEGYCAVQCENLIRDGVKKCENRSSCCRATKHSCSVSCYTTTQNCQCNCPEYSTHG